MGDRMQRAKGKAREIKGATKKNVGKDTAQPGTEAKGAGEQLRGKAQNTVGRMRSAAKKATR